MHHNSSKKVAVAMSGGVDSSVAAFLLKEQGYQVFGLMLRLWSPNGETENRCCSSASMDDAREIADILGIPFYILDVQSVFKEKIVNYYMESYVNGITPNPCILCNKDIRFGHLLNEAQVLGADYLATGHYVRLHRRHDNQFQLRRGIDLTKDQSYMLYRLDQSQLSKALFPVGDFTKDAIRGKAKQMNLPVFSKKDSQDLCFLGKNSQKEFLMKHVPNVNLPGPIKTTDDKEIGQHDGLAFYTLGQRKGINIAWHEPLYVLNKDTSTQTLYVGTKEQVFSHRLTASKPVFTTDDIDLPCEAEAQILYRGNIHPVQIELNGNNTVEVRFANPVKNAAPGQSIVFYKDDTLIGGAFISKIYRR